MKTTGRQRWWRAAALAPWVVMMALLLRFEVYPEYFSGELAGYRSLLDGDVLLQDNWSRILVDGNPVGYSHTVLEVDETQPLRHYTLANRVHVRLRALGFEQPVSVDTIAELDVTYTLRRFEFSMDTRHYAMAIEGRLQEGERYAVTMRTPTGTRRSTVEIPADVILYSPMTEMALKRMRPGSELRFRTFDPVAMSPAQVLIRAVREDTIRHRGAEVTALLLTSEYQGITVNAWMDAQGRLLRQETPMGWTIEACSAEEAVMALRDAGRTDAATGLGMAVPVEGRLEAPATQDAVRLRLRGVNWRPDQLASNRQTIESQTEDETILTVRRAVYPPPEGRVPLSAEDRAEALAATPALQSDAPEIRELAERLTADRADDQGRALAILNWVHREIRKEGTISLPNALDVLQGRVGDCNEHTYLFVALARAAGLPAKIMVGLAYHENRYYYHAWPAVYLGDWVEMDPTWGLDRVGVTHLRLIEGELDRQMELVQIVGRLRMAILETP